MKRIAIAVGLTMLGAAVQARADVSEHDKALAAFEEGRRYIESGNCDAAITKLNESVSHEPTIGARASLADCYEKSDALASWKQLRDAARLAFLVHDDRLAVLEARAAQLEQRLPMVRVEGTGFDAPGFELRIDGDLVDPFLYRDRLIATTGGEHRLEALSPGRQWSSRVVAQAGNTTVATVDMQTRSSVSMSSTVSSSGSVQPTPNASAPGGASRAVAYTLGGVGLAGVGAGVAFGLEATPPAARRQRDRSTSPASPPRAPGRSPSWASSSAARRSPAPSSCT